MTSFHGGGLVARTLKSAGVDCLFTLCGGHVMPIYDGCLDEGIRVIDVRHEQAAAHAADAWSRVHSGKIGVAVVTAGPGVTDAVTGVANAWRAGSPMLVIGGQGPFANRGRGSLQEMDHISLMKPITKWADAVYQVDRIPEAIETAIRCAVSGTPGPSFLEIPMDVLMAPVKNEVPIPEIRTTPPVTAPDRNAVRAALDLLAGSEKPVMMVGTGARWSSAGSELEKFLDATCIPAYANGMGRGVLPRDSAHLFQLTRRRALNHCDLLILAGTILDFRLAFGRELSPQTRILQMDCDPSRIGFNRPADVALVGNLAESLRLMMEMMQEESIDLDFSNYEKNLHEEESELKRKLWDESSSDRVPIQAGRLCREIAEFVDEEMILIGDGGDIVGTASKVIPVPKRGYWLDPGPLGTLGVGMPFAIAAQIAHPDKRVLIVYGDGSFGLNGFEYDTAIRFDLPVVGIVGNDGAWGQMMRPQCHYFGKDRLTATLLERTRYDRIVEAMGGYGEYVTRPEEIRLALERAFASGKPACVNVEIERDFRFRGGIYV